MKIIWFTWSGVNTPSGIVFSGSQNDGSLVKELELPESEVGEFISKTALEVKAENDDIMYRKHSLSPMGAQVTVRLKKIIQ